jgi:hypothetical protein
MKRVYGEINLPFQGVFYGFLYTQGVAIGLKLNWAFSPKISYQQYTLF